MSLTKVDIIDSIYEKIGIPKKTASVSLKVSLKSSRMISTKVMTS